MHAPQLTVRVATHRFNEAGTSEAGAAITPELVVEEGKTAMDYRFDLASFVWVPATHGEDLLAQAQALARPSALDEFFGMNGTEL